MELFTTDTWKKDKNERDLNKMRSKGNFDDLVSLSSLAKSELHWWIQHVGNAYNVINHPPPQQQMWTTDASLMGRGRDFQGCPILMSRIELNESIVQLVLHIWQRYLKFSYYFIFDWIVCVLVTFYQWEHFVMLLVFNPGHIWYPQEETGHIQNLNTTSTIRKCWLFCWGSKILLKIRATHIRIMCDNTTAVYATPRHATSCNTIQHNAMQCNAIQCNAIQYNTIQYNTMLSLLTLPKESFSVTMV